MWIIYLRNQLDICVHKWSLKCDSVNIQRRSNYPANKVKISTIIKRSMPARLVRASLAKRSNTSFGITNKETVGHGLKSSQVEKLILKAAVL